MRRGTLLRLGFGTVVALLMVYSMLGILLTGPIVVRAPNYDKLVVTPSVERLRKSVETLCGKFSPRDYRNPANLDAAADWIAERFRMAGLEVEFQTYEVEGQSYRNVIGTRRGMNPAAGTIVIGAHFDAYGPSAGANDNASGVAVLLELAETLPPVKPEATHIFAAFNTEEPPFFRSPQMGSYKFAEKLRAAGTRVDLMVALDLVGYYSDEPNSQRFPIKGLGLYYPNRGNFAAIVGDAGSGRSIRRVKMGMMATEAIPIRSLRAPSRLAPVDFSDHWAFRQVGFPGVLVTDTAFLRYEHYHEAEDTPDKLDYVRMGKLVQALHGVLWESIEP